jgi:hypothetical protein
VLQRFITQYHTIFFIVFLGLSIGLAYSIGLEAGKRRTDGVVTLSCPSLEALSLPIQEKEGGIQQPRVEGTSTEAVSKGRYVGSKNGTKYYTPGCPGTTRIKPENYIWFETVEDATLQGYSKGSC